MLVVAWIAAAGVGGPYFGKISDVASNDLATFLPSNAESTRVKHEVEKFRDSSAIPAIVVFESPSKLTPAQYDTIAAASSALQKTGLVQGEVSSAVRADDEKAAFILVPLDPEAELSEVIPRLQEAVKGASAELKYEFTGPAMFSRDLQKAFAGIDGTLLVVALSAVFLILLVVYRSPLLPIMTLTGAIAALSAAIFTVWHLADAGIVLLNGQVQGILFILVIGAATDYSLLYISRYREELRHHRDSWQATKAAWKGSWEPIVAAGGTVSLGLLCLLVSDLGSNRALGPVGTIGIGFSILAALTFLPAVLLLLGRVAFWPRRPKYTPGKRTAAEEREMHPVWSKVGAFVGRHPRRIWMGTLAVLLLMCIGVPQLKAEGVSQQNLILGKSEARDGQALLDRHFASGSGSPVDVLVKADDQEDVVRLLEAEPSVDAVSMIATDKSSVPVGRLADEIKATLRQSIEAQRQTQLDALRTQLSAQMTGAPTDVVDAAYQSAARNIPSVDSLVERAYPFGNAKPLVLDNTIVLQATLKHSASSLEAREAVSRLRQTVEATHPGTAFGGVSAIQLDTNTAAQHDLRMIIPLILLAITIVLMLLLRSIVAPLVLLVTTVISFGSAIGVSALLFNHVWNFPGADPSVIIYGFVFLVALGIDYNIFLMSRVREETLKHGVRRGTLGALVVTGGVITSAGVVLAATFAALGVIPIMFLAQIAFIVAFGVLLDTLVVRSLLVPALTLEIGPRIWWPLRKIKK